MCMNPNVYRLSETQKRSPQVTLNHERNSSFVFTLTKENVKTRKEDKIHYNLGQNMLMHQPKKHICLTKISMFSCHPAKNGNHRQMNARFPPFPFTVQCCLG